MRTIAACLYALVIGGCASQTVQQGAHAAHTAGDTARDGVGGAVAAPLHDINVLRTKIPPALLAARDAPYARPKSMSCAALADEIGPLDAALGADLDRPKPARDTDAVDRDALAAGGLAVDAMKGAAEGLIPFRGWVRRLTGAERHDKLVRQAVSAGTVRRAYLKGVGLSKGCKPPSAPANEALAAVPAPHPDKTPPAAVTTVAPAPPPGPPSR